MVMGEEMPSKDDPKYKERYQKEREAGMRFAALCQQSPDRIHRTGVYLRDWLFGYQCPEHGKII